MALLTTWPAYTDDTGVKTDGTIVNAALLDAVKAAIIADIESATNPTIAPKTITDEVVTARGSKASLDERLDVSMEEDGTLKAIAGQASEAQLAAGVGHGNWLQNDNFLIWPAGDAAVPVGYVLATATIARTGVGLGDTTTKVGPFSAKLTRAGADGTLTQFLMNATSFGANGLYFRGRKFGFGAWVNTSTSNQARLEFYDGVTSTVSGWHTGGGTWEWLSGVHTVSGTADRLQLSATIRNSSGDAYFSGMTALPGILAPAAWIPCQTVYGSLNFVQRGTLTVGTFKDLFRPARPFIVKDVNLRVLTPPTGAAIICDFNQYDGAVWQTMFTTKPQIAAAASSGNARPDGTYTYRCFSPGLDDSDNDDILGMDIDQVGSGTAGVDLWTTVRVMQYLRPQESLLDYADS